MPAIITSKFRVNNAKQLIESFGEAEPNNTYLFIGGIRPWADDLNPPVPSNNFQQVDYSTWREMVAMKRIKPQDVSHVIPRRNWTSGVVYEEYDDTVENIDATNFYVMNSDYYVYKCIKQPFYATGDTIPGGFSVGDPVPSTFEPTGTSTSIITTDDGYKWKFMYEISGASALKFITPTHIPVQTLETNNGSFQWAVQQAATDGSIDHVKVTNPGVNYNQHFSANVSAVTNASTFSFQLATANPVAFSDDDFYNGATVYISGGTGIGQIATIDTYTSNGVTGTITLTEPLSTALNPADTTFKVTPTVTLTSETGGQDFQAYVDVSSGTIKSIEVVNPGSGYTEATAQITISSAAIAAGATGNSATIKPIISPKGGHGSDAVRELGGYYVMLNSRLSYDEGGTFTTKNDFRQLGLVVDPELTNSTIAGGDSYDMSTRIQLFNNSAAYLVDEEIVGQTSGARAFVIDVDSTTGTLRVVNVTGTFVVGEQINGLTSTASTTIDSLSVPEIRPFTGNVTYIENRQPIARAVDQVEDIKLIIQF